MSVEKCWFREEGDEIENGTGKAETIHQRSCYSKYFTGQYRKRNTKPLKVNLLCDDYFHNLFLIVDVCSVVKPALLSSLFGAYGGQNPCNANANANRRRGHSSLGDKPGKSLQVAILYDRKSLQQISRLSLHETQTLGFEVFNIKGLEEPFCPVINLVKFPWTLKSNR